MSYTQEPLTARYPRPQKCIHVVRAAAPEAGAVSTHWLSGANGKHAIGNAAIDTQRARLYQLCREVLALKSQDPEIVALQQEAKAICYAISTEIRALRAPSAPDQGQKEGKRA